MGQYDHGHGKCDGGPAELHSLNVLDDQVISVEVLELGVALSVAEQVQDDLCRLHWPSALAHLEGLRLRSAADAASVLTEWNAALLLDDILQVSLGSAEIHALDCLASLV